MTKVVHKDISQGFIMSHIDKVPLRAWFSTIYSKYRGKFFLSKWLR